MPGFRHAAGGQLVQATDAYVGTLRARIVLADDDGVRARLTASWLVQAGWDHVFVLENAHEGQALEQGPEPSPVFGPDVPGISAEALQAQIDEDAVTVFDLSVSRDYRRAHVPGAIWLSRPHLAEALAEIPDGRTVVLVSPDGVLARFAAADLPGREDLVVLEGGFRALAGRPPAADAGASLRPRTRGCLAAPGRRHQHAGRPDAGLPGLGGRLARADRAGWRQPFPHRLNPDAQARTPC
ncbi:MAG: rhodanese-like domain-containing protein [Acetobacteraceae bacterium]